MNSQVETTPVTMAEVIYGKRLPTPLTDVLLRWLHWLANSSAHTVRGSPYRATVPCRAGNNPQDRELRATVREVASMTKPYGSRRSAPLRGVPAGQPETAKNESTALAASRLETTSGGAERRD